MNILYLTKGVVIFAIVLWLCFALFARASRIAHLIQASIFFCVVAIGSISLSSGEVPWSTIWLQTYQWTLLNDIALVALSLAYSFAIVAIVMMLRMRRDNLTR